MRHSTPIRVTLALCAGLACSPSLAQCSPETVGALPKPGDHEWGGAFALDGATAAAGSKYFNNQAGIAYTYTRDENGTWQPEQVLAPEDPGPIDEFGADVAIEGDLLLVSASYWDQWGGAVYAFERDANGDWTQRFQIRPPDPGCDQSFADGIALSGHRVVVSAEEACGGGAAYVLARADDRTWSVEARLSASDPGTDTFGASVAIRDDLAAVGTSDWSDHPHARAFVFARLPGGGWKEEAVLIPPADPDDGSFLVEVQLAHASLLMRAYYDDFTRFFIYGCDADGLWSLEDELIPDGYDGRVTGPSSAAIYDGLAVMGTPRDDRFGLDVGAGHIFLRDGDGRWTHAESFIPDGFKGGGLFGEVVRGRAYQAGIVGMSPAGFSMMYDMTLSSCAPCPADINGDGALDLFDFLWYVNAFNDGADRADCTGEGVLDIFDFLCFVNAFNEGCP
jgi:hypothetical protein